MRNFVFTIIFISIFGLFSKAQSAEGARVAGLAGTAVTLSDQFSAFHNQAGLAHITSPTFGAYYQNRFLIKELGDKGIVAATKLGAGAFAISYSSFGYSAFNQSKTGLGYGLKLSDKFSVGVQMNYHSLRISEGYGVSRSFSVEGGFIYKMNQELTLAGHIENANRSQLTEYNDERSPSTLRFGASYTFSEKVVLLGQVQQTTQQKVVGSGAVEYTIKDAIVLRAGFASNPALSSFGFGWKSSTFRADIATSYHSVLGFSPQISLSFCPGGF